MFCLGDFNIDVSKPSKDRKELFDILAENGLEQLIKKTTRQTTKSSTILDLIITNSDCVLDSGVLYNNISDHYQVYVTRKHTKKHKQPTNFLGRNYLNYNIETLQNKFCYKLHGNQDEKDMHLSANLALLEKRREAHILNFMYKRKEFDIYLDDRHLPTRAYQAPKFTVPKFNNKQFTNSLLYKGSQLWNQLPNEIKNIDSYLAFKNTTKQRSK